MSDDVHIKITGSNLDLKRELKKAERVLNRFDKANKKSSQRREKQAKKTSQNIQRITAAEVRHTMGIRRRMSRMLERDRKQREREAIRAEKRVARERERILRRHAARRRRIMRGVARFGMRALGLLGIGGGIGVIYKAREILKFDEVLARTAAQARATVEEQVNLRDSINNTALEFGVQRDVILETVKAIVDKTGDIRFASRNLDRFAKIIRGMGADPRELGLFISSLKDALVGMDDKQLFEFMEVIIATGDKAKVNLAELAGQGERLFATFLGAGFEGRKAFAEYAAFIQMAAKTGDVAEGTTSVTRFVTSLIKNWKKLETAGVRIYGKGGKIRDIGDILRDLMQITGGDMRKITKLIPNIRAFRGLQAIAGEYRKLNGEMRTYNDLVETGYNASDNIDRKFRRVAETASQGFERMVAGLTLLADKALVDVLNDISESIGRLLEDPQGLKQLETTFREIGKTLGVAWKLAAFGAKGVGIAQRITGGGDMLRLEDIQKRIKQLPPEYQRQAKLPLWRTMLPGFLGAAEERLEQMEFKVENNIRMDEKGNITESDTILNAQVNNDRGLTTVQKSIKQTKLR